MVIKHKTGKTLHLILSYFTFILQVLFKTRTTISYTVINALIGKVDMKIFCMNHKLIIWE